MFIRSIENPEAIKTFMNWLLRIYTQITNTILWIILIICLISYIIFLIANTESSKEITTNLKDFKQYFKQWHRNIKTRFTWKKVINIFKKWFLKAKPYLRKCRHLVIWYILLLLARTSVSIAFWFIWQNFPSFWTECVEWEAYMLWLRAAYSLIFFLIAPIFITYCFWNKFVRNIGIFIYILWIIFILLWLFLQLWCPAI